MPLPSLPEWHDYDPESGEGEPLTPMSETYLNFFNTQIEGLVATASEDARASAVSEAVARTTVFASVHWFGAVGDGATDDSAAFTAGMAWLAARGGGVLFVPPGVHIAAGLTTPDAPIVIMGTGAGSILRNPTASTNTLTIAGAWHVQVRDLQFDASVTRTGGWFIDVQTNQASLERLVLRNFHGGVRTTGTIVSMKSLNFREGTAGTGIPILVAGGFDVSITDVVADRTDGQQMAAGIKVTGVGDLTIEDVNMIHCGNALHVEPSSGVIASIVVTKSFFDTSTRGLFMYAGTGSVNRCTFTQTWFSGHTGPGVVLSGAGANVIDGVDLVGCHVFNNSGDGIQLGFSGVKHVNLVGNAIAGNTGAGISVATGVSDWSLSGNRIGPGYGYGPNAFGIFIAASSSTRYAITGNVIRGNTGTPQIAGDNGATKVVANNLTA